MAADSFFNVQESAPIPTDGILQSSVPVFLIAAGILFVFGIFFVVQKIRRSLVRPRLLGTSKDDIQKKWRMIEEMARRGDDVSMKFAVMEADTLLDHVLKSMRFAGSTMGERLKVAAYTYPRVRRAWQGHIVRNQLAHETTYHLSPSVARQALDSFRQALAELGII